MIDILPIVAGGFHADEEDFGSELVPQPVEFVEQALIIFAIFPDHQGLVHDLFLLIDNGDVMLEFADIDADEKLTIAHDELHG